ncbi:uncharacterized protein LOC116193111 [Punica granatum]|uniref:Uncharacterized protein LOC116193111 n=1 Tax=Punica granatum TaxID=22663 RepID=A0A6P8C4U0_PUNGR|nr:uncharacterized protein LOC116193111 [Punica granatum]
MGLAGFLEFLFSAGFPRIMPPCRKSSDASVPAIFSGSATVGDFASCLEYLPAGALIWGVLSLPSISISGGIPRIWIQNVIESKVISSSDILLSQGSIISLEEVVV